MLKRVVFGVAAVGVVVALSLWRMSWMAPSWWAPPDANDQQVIALADRIEYWLIEQAHKIRPNDEPWQIRVSDDQVNAWLSARLPSWVTHAHELDWPPQLGLPQVHFGAGGIDVGLQVSEDGRSRFVAALLVPRFIDGELSLAVDRISLGRLWIPGAPNQMLLERLNTAAPAHFVEDPKVQPTIRLLLRQHRLDPTLTLADGRRVRLLDIRCTRGGVILRCETEAAAGSPPQPGEHQETGSGQPPRPA